MYGMGSSSPSVPEQDRLEQEFDSLSGHLEDIRGEISSRDEVVACELRLAKLRKDLATKKLGDLLAVPSESLNNFFDPSTSAEPETVRVLIMDVLKHLARAVETRERDAALCMRLSRVLNFTLFVGTLVAVLTILAMPKSTACLVALGVAALAAVQPFFDLLVLLKRKEVLADRLHLLRGELEQFVKGSYPRNSQLQDLAQKVVVLLAEIPRTVTTRSRDVISPR